MTKRQLEANRRNAQQSTGPRSEIGKVHASSNSLKHGLTAEDLVLPGEDPDDYDSFHDALFDSLDPQGALEDFLADKIITDAWRLRRVPIFEAALHRRGCQDLEIDQARSLVGEFRAAETAGMIEAMTRIHKPSQGRMDAQRELDLALRANQELVLCDPLLSATRVLETSVDAFSNLWRQERALTRSLLRTLHELQRLQAIRAGEHVPAPAVVDLNLNLNPAPALDPE